MIDYVCVIFLASDTVTNHKMANADIGEFLKCKILYFFHCRYIWR